MRIQPLLLVLITFANAAFLARSQTCSSITSEKEKSVIDYVRKQYKIAASTEIKVSADEPVAQTCYRLVTLEGRGPVKKWQLKLYVMFRPTN